MNWATTPRKAARLWVIVFIELHAESLADIPNRTLHEHAALGDTAIQHFQLARFGPGSDLVQVGWIRAERGVKLMATQVMPLRRRLAVQLIERRQTLPWRGWGVPRIDAHLDPASLVRFL